MSEPIALPLLRALARRYPTADAVVAEIGYLEGILTLPKGTIHVVSDVHGEDKKLKHIVNNASGSLRPLATRLFAGRLSPEEIRDLLAIIYYPREAYAWNAAKPGFERRAFLLATLAREVELLRHLMQGYTLRHAERLFPPGLAGLFRELIAARGIEQRKAFLEALVDPFVRKGRDVALLRAAAYVIRNLSVAELIVAGDLGDRGPRLDRVVSLLMRQPHVRVVWGNHDVSWMGASLGSPALIATVLRISIRYRRLTQIEEGYGISVAPIERLARTVYADDPAERFDVKGEGLRDPRLMARMQKAMAIIQLKLEGQLSRRRPEYGMEHRQLLHRIDPRAGTVTIDGVTHPLLDTCLPTVDHDGDPYALSADEQACMDRLQASFLASPTLRAQMGWLARRGSMSLCRDTTVIFHGCVPVDEAGLPLSLVVDGEPRSGRELFTGLERTVHRAFKGRASADVDMLWYLWTGPRSPLFGKDRMATFESHFIADRAAAKEVKNPYFSLLHEPEFCARICRELGVDEARGLIVNGHVPVKLEAGESPVKRGGRAVTIDGAFSEAYGDKGFTLVIEAGRTALAQHHHFESVEEAVASGADIIPTVTTLASHEPPRRVADTEKGEELRREIAVLEALLEAYEGNLV
ncbi:MAG: fructose-bisphosphatase class III [Myxococcales bacterium]|nr:fructose-bisphosphatase class III [Myxococcales bacterium]MBL0194945.1 fructose-bisphosphatase class III [Myxococcales bacterium]